VPMSVRTPLGARALRAATQAFAGLHKIGVTFASASAIAVCQTARTGLFGEQARSCSQSGKSKF
jgi:hypothetical protein